MRKNIGWNGKTLQGMLAESEESFKETGRYCGLEKLELKEKEPIRYEKIFSRLRGGLVSARETCMNISATPVVQEEGELCYALYTPEGDSVVVSTGILVHVHTMSDAIKYMLRNNYEEEPGIASGDIFTNNDPSIANVHSSDVMTMVPIFWEDELVGWAAGVTQEIDIGALSGGGAPLGPTTIYEDGLILPCVKAGENDTIRRDYQIMCQRKVRTPMYWNLDERTRLAGCHMVRQAVYRVIEQEGIDTFKRFIREVIEDGRRTFTNRIKELLVPGTYRSPGFMDITFADEQRLPPRARKDIMMHAPFELKIGVDGSFNLSFEGATGWGWNSFNCSPTAMQGAMWVLLTQTVASNDKVNDGAYLATDINLPVGSWANPQNPVLAHGQAWTFLMPAFTGMFISLSRGFQARGFVEEVISGYPFTGNVVMGEGIDHYGKESAETTFEQGCVGSGARMVRDGLDYAAAMWNPEGDMGDVESWETLLPYLYLGRRVKPNSGGWGKFRGGSGFESLRMLWKAQYYELGFCGNVKVFCSSGLFGGYPGSAGYRHIFHDTDILERARAGWLYPVREGSPDESELAPLVDGKESFDKRSTTLPEEFKQGDVYLHFLRGAPGLGDPLERSPNKVAEDLNGDHITENFAKRVYGVVTNEDNKDEWEIDTEATVRQREAMKQQRAQRSIPVREWLKKTRERVAKKDFISPVKEMYASSMGLSESWAKEYRRFWNLPENFTYEEN